MLRIVHLTSVPLTLWFLEEQVRVLGKLGAEVTAISSPGPELDRFHRETGVATRGIPITRTVSPVADARSLWKLYRALRSIRPGLVVAGTPKAGLLGVIAARLAGVPAIVSHVHGLPHTSKAGFRGLALRASTRIACAFSHKVICVSQSVARLLEEGGFCPPAKLVVPAHGSACGVDAENKFNPAKIAPARSKEIRLRCGIPEEAVIVGFAGRLVVDKGCRELAAAWRMLSRENPKLNLLVAGFEEPHDPLPPGLLESWKQDSRVHFLGTVRDMDAFFAAIDVLVLPTYREGFPVVVLEAAAMAVPTVASRVTGCIDAVVEGVTGKLVEPYNPHELAAAIRRYVDDESLRRRHGQAARARVLCNFQPSSVIAATLEVYRQMDPANTASNWKGPKVSACKRVFDVGVAAAGLVLLAPLLAAIAIAIRVTMGRPVIFRQVRTGYRGRLFRFLKFRTMREDHSEDGVPLPDADRLTPLGQFLRRSSLDELPQLWNVLKGDMSLVGPRPLLPQYLPRYSRFQSRRHEVMPGITGWAQVNGRNGVDWDNRFQLDVWYVEHRSFWLDLRILALTLLKVARCEGTSQEGHATMPEFAGAGDRSDGK